METAMKSAILFTLPSLILLASQPLPAKAQPASQTTYSYYPVSGSSLRELQNGMARGGPSANGVKGYGVTTVAPGKRMSVASCKKNGGYHFDVAFVIRLPRAASTRGLSSAEIGHLNRFVRFVKMHEETHRSIWMNFAAKFDRQLQAGGVRDCASAHAKAMTLWNKMILASRPQQIAFDQQQRGPLKAQLFMKIAAR
jgi:predicted secreted Zn-dependent protease